MSAFTADDVAALDLPEGWEGMKSDGAISPNPTRPLVAVSVRRVGANGRGTGIWNVNSGRLEQWWPGGTRFRWTRNGAEAIVVEFTRDGDLVRHFDTESRGMLGEVLVPTAFGGCRIEDLRVSGSGAWLTTVRTSGQGEWGYDVIRVDPMSREAGIDSKKGYMIDPPAFSADESHLVGGYGESWLGGWWTGPDDDRDQPAQGGEIAFGRLFVHRLPHHQVSWHELKMEIPKGWLPDDPWADEWSAPSEIAPYEDGVRMTLPGGEVFTMATELPQVITLPTPMATRREG